MRISPLVCALALSASTSGAAFALYGAAPTPDATPTVDAAAKAAKSAECYQQADAKNLHAKERRMFHSKCMKAP